MRIYIIGATGQLGSDLIRALQAKGHDVDGHGRKEFDLLNSSGEEIAMFYNLEFGRFQPNRVIYLAALHDLAKCEADRDSALQLNARVPRQISAVAARGHAKFFFVSTDYVFGYRDPFNIMLDERAYPCPQSIYGLSKFVGERTIFGTTVRTSGLFGLTPPSGKSGNFVDLVVNKLKAGEKLTLPTDQTTCPTPTRWLADQFNTILEAPFPLIHATSQRPLSWFEWAKMIASVGGLDGSLIEPKTDLEQLKLRPGWSAMSSCFIDFKCPLEDELAWYLKEKHGVEKK